MLTDPKVSRYHLELRPVHDQIEVADKGSTNGTQIVSATIRGGAATVPAGIVVTELPIAATPWKSWQTLRLSLGLLRVARNRSSQRVLETVDSMIPGVEYATDLPGSMCWADAILDRVEVLAHSPEGEWVFGATCELDREASCRPMNYSPFVAPSESAPRKLRRFVQKGRLYEGQDEQSASPRIVSSRAQCPAGTSICREKDPV